MPLPLPTPTRAVLTLPVMAAILALAACGSSQARRLMREADALYDAGELAGALPLYEQVVELEPGHHEAWYSLGVVRYTLEDWSGSLAALDRAVELHDGRAPYHVQRGDTLTRLSRLDDALASYGRAIEIDPNQARAYYAIGIVHYNRREYDLAVEWLEQYLRRAPRNAEDRPRVRQLIEFLEE